MTSNAEQTGMMSRFEPLLNAIAVFILSTTFLAWDASRAVYVLLALGALVYVIKYRPRLPRDQRLYSWPIIAYVGSAFLAVAYDGFSDSGVNRLTSRYLLLLVAIPLVSLFFASFNPGRNPWIKFVMGAIVMGSLALVDMLILDEYRAGGGHNEAVFGFSAAAMTIIVIASYHRIKLLRFGKIYYTVGVSMGLCAMFLSGTRTSWISAAAAIVLAVIFFLERYSLSKRILVSIALICCLAAASMTIPLVEVRVDSMIEQFTPYLKGEEQTKFTSLRYRVEGWKAAWQMGLSEKAFGIGPGNFKKSLKVYIEGKPHLASLVKLNHAHNQFLQTFLISGLVGLVSLFVLIICHLWLFFKYLDKSYSVEVRSLALSGFLLVVAYVVYSIPGVPFYGKHYLMMYAFSTASIWGCLLGALKRSEQTDEGRAGV